MVGITNHPSNYDCLEECQNTPNCAFYTFEPTNDICYLLQTCPVISAEDCPNCISGKL